MRKIMVIFLIIPILITLSSFEKAKAATKAINSSLSCSKLYPVMVGGKYGYINQKGESVIKPQFDSVNIYDPSANIFSDSICLINKGGEQFHCHPY